MTRSPAPRQETSAHAKAAAALSVQAPALAEIRRNLGDRTSEARENGWQAGQVPRVPLVMPSRLPQPCSKETCP